MNCPKNYEKKECRNSSNGYYYGFVHEGEVQCRITGFTKYKSALIAIPELSLPERHMCRGCHAADD